MLRLQHAKPYRQQFDNPVHSNDQTSDCTKGSTGEVLLFSTAHIQGQPPGRTVFSHCILFSL